MSQRHSVTGPGTHRSPCASPETHHRRPAGTQCGRQERSARGHRQAPSSISLHAVCEPACAGLAAQASSTALHRHAPATARRPWPSCHRNQTGALRPHKPLPNPYQVPTMAPRKLRAATPSHGQRLARYACSTAAPSGPTNERHAPRPHPVENPCRGLPVSRSCAAHCARGGAIISTCVNYAHAV